MNQDKPHDIDRLVSAWEDRRKAILQKYKACTDAAYREILSCEALTIEFCLDDLKAWRDKQSANFSGPNAVAEHYVIRREGTDSYIYIDHNGEEQFGHRIEATVYDNIQSAQVIRGIALKNFAMPVEALRIYKVDRCPACEQARDIVDECQISDGSMSGDATMSWVTGKSTERASPPKQGKR